MKPILVLTITLLFITGCQTDFEQDPKPPVPENLLVNFKVVDNILHFENSNDFDATLDYVWSLDPIERRNFEQRNGYVSMKYEFENFFETWIELGESENDNESATLIDAYSDIITFQAETPDMIIHNKSVSPLINRSGLVYIDDIVYKYTEYGQVLNLEGNLEEILQASASRKEGKHTKIIDTKKLASNTLKAACGTFQNRVNTNSSGNRRALFYTELQYNPTYNSSNNTYNVTTRVYARGAAEKTNWRGNWKSYKTNNTLDTDYEVYLFNGQIFSSTYIYSNTNYAYIDHSHSLVNQQNVPSSDIGELTGYFTQIDSRYKHTGMNGVWTTIDCQ